MEFDLEKESKREKKLEMGTWSFHLSDLVVDRVIGNLTTIGYSWSHGQDL